MSKELAVVVGATGAMGQVICRRLSTAGLRVIAVARSEEQLSELVDDDANITACAADMGSDGAVDQLKARIDAPVRMVVHGPGVPTAGGILTAPTAALVEAVNIKVGGMVRLVRAVEHRLQPHSRLVAIGGHYGFEPTAYAATAGVANAALANLVRQLSWAYGPRQITAHLIAPGPADTDRLRRVAEARAEREGTSTEAVFEDMKRESAIGRLTDIDGVAWAVELLLAPEADNLAGSTLFMDAGRRRGLP